jgi:hypothetical protein
MANWARPVAMAVGMSAVLAGVTLVGVSVVQGDSWQVSRRRAIAASAGAVHGQLDDLQAFLAWQTLERPEEPPTTTFSTPSAGVGAWMEQRTARAVSRTTLTSSSPEVVRYEVESTGSLGTGQSRIDVVLHPAGDRTDVELIFTGRFTVITRLMWPLFRKGLTSAVGDHLDSSLATLEQRVVPAATPMEKGARDGG